MAKGLLGKTLVRRHRGGPLAGIITETEAYRASDDPASHAFGGATDRNAAMFGTVGAAYVYMAYGMHHCVNAVARRRGAEAGAVLIRAVRPLAGEAAMMRNRGLDGPKGLADGPAKLAQAMRITREQYGADLTDAGSALFVAAARPGLRFPGAVARRRVGISRGADRLWNFSIEA